MPTELPPDVDVTKPSSARIYDYVLGGKDNFEVDRETADKVRAVIPEGPRAAHDNRGFMARAVRFAAQLGIRQFLDVGSGLPTQGNVHEIAQEIAPGSRVVYVDNDALTHAHSVALLDGDPDTAFVVGDVREPEAILASRPAQELLDFSLPVAVLCVALFHFVGDDDDPPGLVRRLVSDTAKGSVLVVSSFTDEDMLPDVRALISQVYGENLLPRSREWIERLFPWPLVEPGLADVARWRGDPDAPIGRIRLLGGVAVRPDR
jgi:hypothetical protein